jgi:AcrR family transcriptional regulator
VTIGTDGLSRMKPDTVSRILNGALVALARRGVRELSMTDVGHAAGISRGTLYRYFSSKEELLDAIGVHVERSLINEMVRAVDERPDLDVRVQVVVETIVNFGQSHPEASQVIAVEPGFGIEFVRRVFPEYIAVVEQLLTPALERSSAVRSGGPTPGELSELILRVAATTFFIPTADIDDVPRAISALPCLQYLGS